MLNGNCGWQLALQIDLRFQPSKRGLRLRAYDIYLTSRLFDVSFQIPFSLPAAPVSSAPTWSLPFRSECRTRA